MISTLSKWHLVKSTATFQQRGAERQQAAVECLLERGVRERWVSERVSVRQEAWWAERRSTSRGCLEETKSLCCDEKWLVEKKQRLRLRPRWKPPKRPSPTQTKTCGFNGSLPSLYRSYMRARAYTHTHKHGQQFILQNAERQQMQEEKKEKKKKILLIQQLKQLYLLYLK